MIVETTSSSTNVKPLGVDGILTDRRHRVIGRYRHRRERSTEAAHLPALLATPLT